MSSLLYTTYEPRKHKVSHSRYFVAPSNNNLSKNSQTQLIPVIKYNLKQQKRKTSAKAKVGREYLLTKRKRDLFEVGPLPPDRDEEFPEVYPFVEEPVTFDFGAGYVDEVFADLEKELSFMMDNYGRGLCADVVAPVDHGFSDDVLKFSFDEKDDLLLLDQYFSAKSS